MKLINHINSSLDIKCLSEEEMKTLAERVRLGEEPVAEEPAEAEGEE